MVRRIILGWVIWLGCSAIVLAHDSRPLVVNVTQVTGSEFRVHSTVPGSVASRNLPMITVSPCDARDQAKIIRSNANYQITQNFLCETLKANVNVAIKYPESNPSLSSILRVQRLEQPTYTQILAPDVVQWPLFDDREGSLLVLAQQYVVLGVEHIAGGIDHLLYVLCLVWLARRPKRIFLTVTGFTLAHSMTLAVATLGWFAPDQAVTEACIALSIVFLVSEIARGEHHKTLVWRYPALISALFGLLHGFGFAGALREVGLPSGDVPLALLSFNLGVELGQIAFIALVLVVGWSAVRFIPKPQSITALRTLCIYSVGAVSVSWLIERTLAVVA